jgi:hypothetical protein
MRGCEPRRRLHAERRRRRTSAFELSKQPSYEGKLTPVLVHNGSDPAQSTGTFNGWSVALELCMLAESQKRRPIFERKRRREYGKVKKRRSSG